MTEDYLSRKSPDGNWNAFWLRNFGNRIEWTDEKKQNFYWNSCIDHDIYIGSFNVCQVFMNNKLTGIVSGFLI